MKPDPRRSQPSREEPTMLVAQEDAGGQRLDAYIAARMPPHVSRSRVKALIKQGQVSVEGAVCTEPNFRLAGGEAISLVVPEPVEAAPAPERIELDILHEDSHLIVVNKAPGMVVHPAVGNWTGTLVNALLHHCGGTLAGIGGVRRPGIVHRLDKDTSGILVAAKTDEAHTGLSEQFADHGRSGALERQYQAIVWGVPEPRTGRIDAPIGRSPSNRLKQAVVDGLRPGARDAVTLYRVTRPLAGGGGEPVAALIECDLQTGRTHQIRVHMTHIGHPLVGDPLYGAHFTTKANRLDQPIRRVVGAFRRQALHAGLLAFDHPATGAAMRFVAPPPADFCELLDALDRGDSR